MSNMFSQFKIQDVLDHDPDKFEPHPRRAWAIIFFAGVVLIVSVMIVHLYVYIYMRTDSSFKPDDSTTGINEMKLNRKGLTEVTAMFEAKNAQSQDLLASPPSIADPSSGMNSPILSPAPVKASPGTVTPKKTIPKNTITPISAQ